MAEEGNTKKLPIHDMDPIDRAQSALVQCEKKTALAFRAIFGNPEDENAQLVLKHLCIQSRYGNNDMIKPEFQAIITGRRDMMTEIKNMLNAAVLFEEEPKKEDEENETEN